MSDPTGATRRLAQLAVRATIDQISPTGLAHARLIVLDTVGVMLAAHRFEVGRVIVDYVRDVGGGVGMRVVGADVRAPMPLAALANGTLAHALDFDDHKHLSTHTLPAALAVGESVSASGRDVVEAFVIGREVGARLGALLEAKRKQRQGPTYRGWYRVGVVGPMASAVAAGRLLQLDESQMATAIGIAASSSAGLRRNQGTMAKALHSGNAAAAGVNAAVLASRGFSGDQEILEAPLGLVQAVCLPGEEDWSALESFGAPYDVEKHLGVKPFPSCSPSHMPLAALLSIRDKTPFSADQVESIEADLHTFSLMRPDPTEAIATGYSLPFQLAAVAVEGRFGLDQVGESRLHDPEIRGLMARVVHDPDAAPAGGPERVTVRLKDGTVLREFVATKESIEDERAIVAKFDDCAGRVLSGDRVARLRDLLLDIDGAGAIATVLDATVPV